MKDIKREQSKVYLKNLYTFLFLYQFSQPFRAKRIFVAVNNQFCSYQCQYDAKTRTYINGKIIWAQQYKLFERQLMNRK